MFAAAPIASAQIIPKAGDCSSEAMAEVFRNEANFRNAVKNQSPSAGEILGCAVKTGRIRLYMMPFFVTYLIEFLLGAAGLVAVLFMVLGGYKYVVGGLTEDKESGKKTILHALTGFVVALSAWIVVNFIQAAITSG